MQKANEMGVTLDTPRGQAIIRPTRESDAEAYRALRLQALQDHPTVFGSDYASSAALPLEHWQERMRKGAGDEFTVTYVAEAGGALIGMTTLVRNEPLKIRHSGMIYSVYTHPAWRGTGVADALLNACVAYARGLGMRVLHLGVVVSNISALGLYLRNGWSVYGVDPESIFYDGIYYDELMMLKRL